MAARIEELPQLPELETMKFKLIIIISALLASCNPKVAYNDNTVITSIVLKSEIGYFDRTIKLFANQSEMGRYYSLQDSILTSNCSKLKTKLQNGGALDDYDQQNLFTHLEGVLIKSDYIDKEQLSQIKKAGIHTTTDVDYLEHYAKCCFCNILQNSKSIPFDQFGILASADKWSIKKGEEFNLDLALTANNASRPLEWFRVKSGATTLDKENVLDTLKLDESGIVFYKTKDYKPGLNKLKFIVRLKMPNGDRQLSQTVNFSVK